MGSRKGFRFCVTVILLAGTVLLAQFPALNGDLPFYIAAACTTEGAGDSAALARAETAIRTELPPEKAEFHLQNLRLAPPHFLDFYRMKAGYTVSIAFFHRLGFSFVAATIIPSVAGFTLLALCVFTWSRRISTSPAAFFWVPLLLFVSAGFQPGRLSTPDAPAQCLLLWAMYRIRFARPAGGTLCCLLLSLLFRPDNLPAACGLLFIMWYLSRGETVAGTSKLTAGWLCLALFSAAAVCVLLNFLTEPEFWWFRPVPYPGVTNVRDPSPLSHFILDLGRSSFPVLLALAAVALTVSRGYWSNPVPDRPARLLLIFLAAMFPVRYLLFPHYEARFFVSFYLAGFLLLGEMICSIIEPFSGRKEDLAEGGVPA